MCWQVNACPSVMLHPQAKHFFVFGIWQSPEIFVTPSCFQRNKMRETLPVTIPVFLTGFELINFGEMKCFIDPENTKIGSI
jgi:hypothetical protein